MRGGWPERARPRLRLQRLRLAAIPVAVMRAGPVLTYSAGILLLCVMDVIVKQLIATYPVVMATWWRYAFALLFTFGFWLLAGRPAITRAMLPLHIVRGVLISLSAVTFFFALTRLTLAETISLSFISPLLVPPLAALLLGERMQAGNLVAAGLGFAGVLVAVGLHPLALTPERLQGVGSVLVSALAYALATVLMRARAARDGAAILSLLGALVPTLVLAPFLFVGSGPVRPDPDAIGWFALAGLCGALALQLFATALARAEAQTLAPFEYASIAWLSLLGWLIFGEPLSARTLAGAALIIAACLWQARRSRAIAPPPMG